MWANLCQKEHDNVATYCNNEAIQVLEAYTSSYVLVYATGIAIKHGLTRPSEEVAIRGYVDLSLCFCVTWPGCTDVLYRKSWNHAVW
jgi:hypothetical protein